MKILSVTTGRSDVGHLEPVWREIVKRQGWDLTILNLGPYQLSLEWSGNYWAFPRKEQNDSPGEISRALAAVFRDAQWAYTRLSPDLILVVGDRYEALGAVSGALFFGIPVAHIGGGDETSGAYDNQIRHAITKMAHVHFVAHEAARERVLAMGEEGWRVYETGLPSLDGIRQWMQVPGNVEHRGQEEGLVVIFHPPTLELDTAEQQAREVGRALVSVGCPVKGFIPGHDVLHEKVRRAVIDACAGRISSEWFDQETPEDFYRTLSRAACLVGNSSAGIIEACSFGLPVINIGSRQEGRVRPINVFDVAAKAGEIAAAILHALSPEIRAGCQGLVNPYGDGHAAGRIVAALASLPDKDTLLKKRWAT